MNIEILNGNVNYYKDENDVHILNFGANKIGTPIFAKVKVLDKVKGLVIVPTCGCTATSTPEDNVFEINYKNINHEHTFSKTIILKYKNNGFEKSEQIKIKGNIWK